MYVGKPWPLGFCIRMGAVAGVALLRPFRRFGLSTRFLPRPLRLVARHWTKRMRRDFVQSRGRRLPIDQPCRLQMPASFEPCAEVEPAHRLSEQEIQAFYEAGFLAPLDVFDAEQLESFRETLLRRRRTASPVYGFVTDRDRHLDTPEMLRMMAHPAIVDRLAQLLGPDLVCWRSQIFYKRPGAGRIGWHQASTYMMEDNFLEPVLFPADPSRLFQLTVWIAIDAATRENGCLEFIPGSHNRIHTMRLGGREGFYAAQFKLEFERDAGRVVPIVMQPGQVLIFSERTIHGSGENRTDRGRMAFNYRVVPAGGRAYAEGKRFHKAVHMAEHYDLSRWQPVLLRGEGRTRVNQTVPWHGITEQPDVLSRSSD